MEQYILLNGKSQVIRTDKETAFTENGFRSMCKSLNIKLLYGSIYMHAATGLVKRGKKNTERLNEIIPGKQVLHKRSFIPLPIGKADNGGLKFKRDAT